MRKKMKMKIMRTKILNDEVVEEVETWMRTMVEM